MTLVFQIISTAFMLASAYFWIRGNLWMSSKTIKELASTQWDCNIGLARNLISQKCDSTIAFAGLVIGFVIQIWACYAPKKPVPFIQSWLWGSIFFLGLSYILYLIGNITARSIERRGLKKVIQMIEKPSGETKNIVVGP